MERILVCFSILIDQKEYTLWIHLDQLVSEFKEEWKMRCVNTTYERFFYHLETKSRIDENQTWKENHVVSGDHIFYI